MNKTLKVILNILIVAAAVAFFVSFLELAFSIRYANREKDDPAQTYAGVFEYELAHRAYGEIMESYYVRRMDSFDPPAGYEDLYRIGEYAHTAFMSGVYEEKPDPGKASLYKEKAKKLRSGLGSYEYTADEISSLIL